MGSQHLNLKWRNHHSNLLSVFAQLLTSESFTDVTLVCDGASIRAHKIILSACSPFFHNIFAQHPCQNPIIVLKDVAYKDLKVLVDFMYSGEVNIAQEYLPSFLQTAESLKIKGLSENESGSCSNSLKRSVQTDSPKSLPSRCKRRRNSRSYLEEKTDDESVDTQDGITKENSPRSAHVSNHSPNDLSGSGGTNRYSSPMQRYEQAYNWGLSTESSKYVEVNLQDDDTNATGQSTCLGQDDSTTDCVEIEDGSPQEMKTLPLTQEVSPDMESLRHLHRATGLMSTITTCYSNSSVNNKEYISRPGGDCDTENVQLDNSLGIAGAVETGHVLTKLPRHKKKDCIVCGNRQAGQRRRSRQWCPGCNVGVHVHCFEKLEHYRRTNKRAPRVEEVNISARSPEMVQVKCEPYTEVNAESTIESEATRAEKVDVSGRSPEIVQVKSEPFAEANAESNVESDAESSTLTEVENVSSEMG